MNQTNHAQINKITYLISIENINQTCPVHVF